ncbi:2-hydroxyacid dehydrogenase [Crocinitomix sp.]|nr:2-hydroxyacid dehydrogenase [Crocinitomix sp.]
MKKIAFIDKVHPVLKDNLENKGWLCDDLTKSTYEELKESLVAYNGIVVRSRFRMDAELLDKATNLEFIARSGAGMENIDIAYCTNRGIELFNGPEGNCNAVAEHALGMLLALFNKLTKADLEVRNGIWDRDGNRGIELDGRTVGIIGYGNNGSAFAKKLRGFDVRVMAYDKFKSGFGDEFVEEVTLSEITEEADVLSLHVPETPVTKGMINKRFISQMDHPFYLINLARGSVVNTNDLVDALDQKKILGACLDVLEYEKSSFENIFNEHEEMPAGFNYLLHSPNVILSPHVGGWTEESYCKLSQVLFDKISAHYKF